jgi:hypothetical protein
MSYGTIKVDTITFTDNSVDKSVSLSGLIQNPTFTGNITVTGTISGDVIRGGTTVSGATVTGTTANFVSGVFTTQISGATVTGTTASFTSGVFTNISGTTATITSGIIASGTAAAPSLAILADLDTGLFSPGADQVAVATNGTGRLFVDASGNVGIATASPGTKFHVNGPAKIGEGVATNTSKLLVNTLAGTAAGIQLFQDATESWIIQNPASSADLTFGASGTERLRITSAGLVGIGTSSPSNTASFGQQLQLTGNLPCITIDNTGTGPNKYSLGVNGSAAFGIWDNTASAYRMYINSSGSIGIGTTGISAKLHVAAGASTVALQLDADTGSNTSIALSKNGSVKWYFGNDEANDGFRFYDNTAGTERLRITSAGLVGIGTSSVNALLEVNSSTAGNEVQRIEGSYNASGSVTLTNWRRTGGAVSSAIKYNDATTSISLGTTTSHKFSLRTADTDAITIDTSQRVGIGTTSPAAKLEVAGGNIRLDNNQGVEWGGVNNYIYGNESTDFIAIATNGNERSRWDSSGRLLVGTSTSVNGTIGSSGNWPATGQFNSTSTNNIPLGLFHWSTYAVDLGGAGGGLGNGPDIVLARSNTNTQGSHVAVTNNILLGRVNFSGSDGTQFLNGACIAAAVDGTPGANDMPGRLVFSTTADGASSPTERMRITSTGQVRLAGAGITFNGDTAAANELDDYEEGTWTPTLGGTATYSFQSATYTKVGRQVTVNCYLDVSAIGTGSTSIISGLPFTVGTFAPASGAVSRLTASAVNVTSLQVQLSGTTVTTVGMTVAGNMATQNVFGTGTAIFFTAVYFV